MADLTRLQQELDEYRKKGYNVLSPTTQLFELSPLQELHYETVQLYPSKQPGGDAYFLPATGKWGISGQGYQRIAIAAGIVWDPQQTRRVPTGDPMRIGFQATGALQKPDGSWIALPAYYEVNLAVKRKQVKRRLETAKDDQDAPRYTAEQIADKLEDEMLREEGFAPQKAETGAKGRVVRAITGMKSVYTADELSKPFIVPKVSLNTNYLLSDPKTRAMILDRAINSSMNIFGPGQGGQRQIAAPSQYAEVVDITSVSKEEPEQQESEAETEAVRQPAQTIAVETKPTEIQAAQTEKTTETGLIFHSKQELLDHFTPMSADDQWKILEAKIKADKKEWGLKEKFTELPEQRRNDALLYYFPIVEVTQTATQGSPTPKKHKAF